jgi:hypothetical protein
VLGDLARLPDKQAYRAERSKWLEFFKQLGMSDEPRTDELLVRLDRLTSAAEPALDALTAVVEHLCDRWAALDTAPVTLDGRVMTFREALRARTWIPTVRESTALAFAAPRARFVKPGDAYPKWLLPLVGSEAPVSNLRSFPAPMARALQVPETPPFDLLLRHFTRVLDAWGQSEKTEALAREAEHTAREFYRAVSHALAEPSRAHVAGVQLRAHLGGRNCIWHHGSLDFRAPAHVFNAPVPFFEPRRVCVPSEPRYDAALDALGRLSEPGADDFLSFLTELASEREEQPLSEHEAAQALTALAKLAKERVFVKENASELVVLCTDKILRPAEEVLIDDAPWLGEDLVAEWLFRADRKVDLGLLEAAGVDKLSGAVVSVLVSAESAEMEDSIQALNRVFGTAEFARGLLRLVLHEYGSTALPSLDFLHRLHVRPVRGLRTRSYLQRRGEARPLREGNATHHFDETNTVLLVSNASRQRVTTFIAEGINRLLKSWMLKNQGPLVSMLQVEQAEEIPEVLNDWKISTFEQEAASFAWDETVSVDRFPEAPGVEPLEHEPPADATEDEPPSYEFADDELPNVAEQGAVWRETPRATGNRVPGQGEAPVRSGARGAAVPTVPAEPAFSRPMPRTDGAEPRPWRGDGYAVAGAVSSEPRESTQGSSRGQPSAPRLDSEGKVAPPTTPGDGSSRAPSSERQERLRSYTSLPGVDDAERSESASERSAVELRAIRFVEEHERKRERVPEVKPHNHPGYDIHSVSPGSGENRYIEVKGLSGPWGITGVSMTRTQFNVALAYGMEAWLYVVERLDSDPVLHRIQDPANRVGTFHFDHGWSAVAEGSAPPVAPLVPAVGMRVKLGESLLGTITGMKQKGPLIELHVRMDDGTERSGVPYRPGVHTLYPSEEGASRGQNGSEPNRG